MMPLASKVLSKILINRIRCGIDYTASNLILNNILEQASEWNATCIMYIHFVDFEKAFDLVPRDGEVWNTPQKTDEDG